MVSITKLTIGSLPTNCYVLSENDSCIVVDPGSDYTADIKRIKTAIGDKKLLAILCTHNHFDHILGAHYFNVPCYLHEADIKTLDQSKKLTKQLRGIDMILPVDIRSLSSRMSLGPFSFQMFHTPGHSPGSCVLLFEKDNLLLSGDTLFAGAYGRTDLFGSDPEAMKESLKRFLDFPDDLLVYPGHGPETSIGAEKIWLSRYGSY